MKVSEVMTRDVQTIRPDQPVQEAASFMLSNDAGSIPVTDGDRLIGMITDRDIAVRGIAKGYGPDSRSSTGTSGCAGSSASAISAGKRMTTAPNGRSKACRSPAASTANNA
jgi:predicted transcriptional regulator